MLDRKNGDAIDGYNIIDGTDTINGDTNEGGESQVHETFLDLKQLETCNRTWKSRGQFKLIFQLVNDRIFTNTYTKKLI